MAAMESGKPVFEGVIFHVDERLSPVTRAHVRKARNEPDRSGNADGPLRFLLFHSFLLS